MNALAVSRSSSITQRSESTRDRSPARGLRSSCSSTSHASPRLWPPQEHLPSPRRQVAFVGAMSSGFYNGRIDFTYTDTSNRPYSTVSGQDAQ